MSPDFGPDLNIETRPIFVWSFLQTACLLEYFLTAGKERIISMPRNKMMKEHTKLQLLYKHRKVREVEKL